MKKMIDKVVELGDGCVTGTLGYVGECLSELTVKYGPSAVLEMDEDRYGYVTFRLLYKEEETDAEEKARKKAEAKRREARQKARTSEEAKEIKLYESLKKKYDLP